MMPDLTSNLVDKNQDKMIGKLRRFDGTTPWMDYEIQFELCAQMNDWGEKTKLRNLACMLDGEAAQVLSTIGKECSTMDYQDLKDALIRRYSPQHQQEVFRLELKNRRRRKDETIPALANEVRRLVRQGWPEENRTTQEALMRDYFLDALDEPELQKEVEVKQPRDINEAEIMTMRMSSILKGCKARERRTATREKEREQTSRLRTLTVDPLPDQADQHSEETTAVLIRALQEAFRGDCFKCGGRGHMANICPTKETSATWKGPTSHPAKPVIDKPPLK
ncbi:MAG: hypothetical protein GY800_02305, partial [Planctomycetes bacterium]|nr:hypothetical protein [Planctomycetota bacterium]